MEDFHAILQHCPKITRLDDALLHRLFNATEEMKVYQQALATNEPTGVAMKKTFETNAEDRDKNIAQEKNRYKMNRIPFYKDKCSKHETREWKMYGL